MKNNYIKLVAVFLLSTTISFAQKTVIIDFGDPQASWQAPGTSNYNNMSEYAATVGSNGIADMVDNTGAATGFAFSITGNFEYFNTSGTQAPVGDAAMFDTMATRDSYFTSDSNPNGIIKISGLDNAKYYSFEIFAGRKTTQNRESKFTITGSNTEIGYLNPGGATADGNNSNIVIIRNVQPSSGEITIGLGKGTNNVSQWSYMNVLNMIETATLSVADEILTKNNISVFPNPVKETLSINYILHQENKTSVSIFDITGRLIFSDKNGSNQAGTYSYTWNRRNNQGGKVATGLYFLEFKIGSKKLTRKIVVE